MTALSANTDPRIEIIQIEMLHKVSPARKMRMVAQMNYIVRTFMIAGLKQRNPEATPEALRRMLAGFLLSDELARKVCDYYNCNECG